MAARIDRLRQNEKIELIIKGTRTTWFRMRNGSDGRETKGIRVGPGRSKEIWEQIPLGATFEAILVDDSGPEGPERKSVAQVKLIKRKGALAGAARKGREPYFDLCEFADYSGASDSGQQRRAIKVARSEESREPELLNISVTRRGLLL